jgi:hypothetical protein
LIPYNIEALLQLFTPLLLSKSLIVITLLFVLPDTQVLLDSSSIPLLTKRLHDHFLFFLFFNRFFSFFLNNHIGVKGSTITLLDFFKGLQSSIDMEEASIFSSAFAQTCSKF